MASTVRLPRRVLGPVVAVLVAALALSGCAAGQVSQTAMEVAAVDGASGTIGQLGILNALLATPTGAAYAKGANAPLQLWVSNASVSSATLTSVSTPAASSVQIIGSADLPANSLVDFTGTGTKLTLEGLTSAVNYGQSIPITFAFSGGRSVTINVPVAIPPERTPGRPNIEIEPTDVSSLWQAGAGTAGAASSKAGQAGSMSGAMSSGAVTSGSMTPGAPSSGAMTSAAEAVPLSAPSTAVTGG